MPVQLKYQHGVIKIDTKSEAQIIYKLKLDGQGEIYISNEKYGGTTKRKKGTNTAK